ncbi:MAG: glycosyltransferase family 2 protein [Oligoflexia bacterium]|nr:glycosyltransferase family 2 protein [Oligoflexia bacterium]
MISIVIPCFNSEANIGHLVTEVKRASASFKESELILVDDASSDHTWSNILLETEKDSWVKGIRLAKNVGEHKALYVGICQTIGQYVLTMDDDLQHDPEDFSKVVEKLQEGNLLVYGAYEKSAHGFFRRIGSFWNGLVASALLQKPIHLHFSSLRGIDKKLIKKIQGYDSRFFYLDGELLRHVKGSPSVVAIKHRASIFDKSRYTFLKLILLHFSMIRSGFQKIQGRKEDYSPVAEATFSLNYE